MSLLAKKSAGGDFELVPEGVFIARCYQIIDLGTQQTTYKGDTKLQHKVLIYWELLDDEIKMSDGRPFSISKKYTLSLDEKSHLYKDLNAWRGKQFTDEELLGFDIKNVLGAYCTLQIVHAKVNDKTYANVNAIMATKEKPEGINDLKIFDMSEPDLEVFNGLSEYLRGQIQAAPEWASVAELAKATGAKVTATKSKDVVLDDIEDAPVNLDEIPF